jgi:hypothetical protein
MNLIRLARCSVLGRAIAATGLVVFGAAQIFLTPDAAAALIIPRSDFATNDRVITFETGTTELPTVSGVSFDPGPQDAGDATFVGSNFHAFGNQYFGNLHVGSNYTYLAIAFSTPQPAVGAFLLRASNGPLTSLISTVFGPNGQPIDSTTTPLAAFGAPSSQLPFVGYYQPAGISEIEWSYPTGQASFFGVDSVVFGAAVPEPDSALLCAIGLFGLFGTLWRQCAIQCACQCPKWSNPNDL